MTDALDKLFGFAEEDVGRESLVCQEEDGAAQLPVVDVETPKENEEVQQIELEKIVPYEAQPFNPYDGEKFKSLQKSVALKGILVPIILRPHGCEYQIVEGHNRVAAATALGWKKVPALVRSLDDIESVSTMIHVNLEKRGCILPSEMGRAYRLEQETRKRQGYRSDIHEDVDAGISSMEQIGESKNKSATTIWNYIRLTYLIPELLQLIDAEKMPLKAGVELSKISQQEQLSVYQTLIKDHGLTINQQLAVKIRELTASGKITAESLIVLIQGVPTRPPKKIAVDFQKIDRFFRPKATSKEIQQGIERALERSTVIDKYMPDVPAAELEQVLASLVEDSNDNQK